MRLVQPVRPRRRLHHRRQVEDDLVEDQRREVDQVQSGLDQLRIAQHHVRAARDLALDHRLAPFRLHAVGQDVRPRRRHVFAQQPLQPRLDVARRRLPDVDHARPPGRQLVAHQVDERLLLGEDALLAVAGQARHGVRLLLAGDRVLQVVDDLVRPERRVQPAHRPLQIRPAEAGVALPAPLHQIVPQALARALVLRGQIGIQRHRQRDLLVLRQRLAQIAQAEEDGMIEHLRHQQRRDARRLLIRPLVGRRPGVRARVPVVRRTLLHHLLAHAHVRHPARLRPPAQVAALAHPLREVPPAAHLALEALAAAPRIARAHPRVERVLQVEDR